MRNILLAVGAAVALYGASLGGAVGQSSNDRNNRWVWVKNNSDFRAVNIYIIPSGSKCCWSRDLLEELVIFRRPRKPNDLEDPDRENSLKVNFDDGSGSCEFDIRITTRYAGWEWFFTDKNVCSMIELELMGTDVTRPPPKNGRRAAPKDETTRKVSIKNESRLAAHSVYAISAEALESGEKCCWSHDLLRFAEIPKQGEREVDFDDGGGICRFHIRITSEKKGTDWYFEDVDVCDAVNIDEARKTNRTITLRTKGGDGKRRLIEIENKSPLRAVGIFIKPKGEKCCWSDNVLREEGIAQKELLRVDVDDDSGKCIYEFRIAKGDGSGSWDEQRDVCSEPSALKLPRIDLK